MSKLAVSTTSEDGRLPSTIFIFIYVAESSWFLIRKDAYNNTDTSYTI